MLSYVSSVTGSSLTSHLMSRCATFSRCMYATASLSFCMTSLTSFSVHLVFFSSITAKSVPCSINLAHEGVKRGSIEDYEGVRMG